MYTLRPLQASLLYHALLAIFVVVLIYFGNHKEVSYEVPIEVAAPKELQNLTEAKTAPKVVLKSINPPKEAVAKSREVFGASRDSLTDSSLGSEGVAAKKGNTLAKEKDSETLLDSDSTSLPTPTEEYLVSEMPSVLSEVRPNYPKAAKDKQLEGAVALDVLIDKEGVVRQVLVIEGPEVFRAGAVEAMKKFKFKPARVDGSSVAVRIRYVLNFKLEF